MGRKKKGKTTTVRVRLVDKAIIKLRASSLNMSVPDYLSKIARKKR